MPKINLNGMPVWDGDPAHLPEAGELYVYRGKKYLWMPCPCGEPQCKRPLGYSEGGEIDTAMTIRLRGNDPGFSAIKMLIKVGASATEIADTYEAKGKQGLAALFNSKVDNAIAEGLTTKKELDTLAQSTRIIILYRPSRQSTPGFRGFTKN